MRRHFVVLAALSMASIAACGHSAYKEPRACGVETSVVADAIGTGNFEVTDDDLELPLDADALRPTAPEENRFSRCFVTSSDAEVRLIADVVDNQADAEDVRRMFGSSAQSFTDGDTTGYATSDGAGALCGSVRTTITFDEGSGDPADVRSLIEAFGDAAGCTGSRSAPSTS